MYIEENLPINYVWFGIIPDNVKKNIIKAAFLNQTIREVILWVSNENKDENIEQFQNIENLRVLEIEENLPTEDIRIIHWIFSDLRLPIIERMKTASDFTRIAVLSKIGGIYLDGDVSLKKTIPKIRACKGILFHSEMSENEGLFFVENDFNDVIAVPKNSEIIKSVITELRIEYRPEKNTFYVSGDLVKVNYIVSELINNISDELLKSKLWDAKEYDIRVKVSDSYYKDVKFFFLKVFLCHQIFFHLCRWIFFTKIMKN